MMLAGGAIIGVIGGALGWWWNQPRTPEELYKARCAACHALPDLSSYAPEDMASIVDTMRQQNGAADVISENEAAKIITYLENKGRR
jgi:mono/diheme cytochrome c family protein